jgi:hypothetical protein
MKDEEKKLRALIPNNLYTFYNTKTSGALALFNCPYEPGCRLPMSAGGLSTQFCFVWNCRRLGCFADWSDRLDVWSAARVSRVSDDHHAIRVGHFVLGLQVALQRGTESGGTRAAVGLAVSAPRLSSQAADRLGVGLGYVRRAQRCRSKSHVGP